MTNIALIARTSNWVEIVNVGGGCKTIAFLEANRQHFDWVCFGHNGPAGSHAIKADRVAKFIEYAAKHGMKAAYKTHAEVWG